MYSNSDNGDIIYSLVAVTVLAVILVVSLICCLRLIVIVFKLHIKHMYVLLQEKLK